MKAQQAKSGGETTRKGAASNGRPASSNGGWRSRVQRPRITDPEQRRATLKKATTRIKTDVTVDLARERRGN